MENVLPPCTCDDYRSGPCKRNAIVEQTRKDLQDTGWTLFGRGSSRDVYWHPASDFVVKLPRACFYFACNEVEYRIAMAGKWPVPQVHLEYYEGIPVVHMERVRMPGPGDWRKFPEWTSELSDGCQCGFNKSGEVVVYDLGYEHEG